MSAAQASTEGLSKGAKKRLNQKKAKEAAAVAEEQAAAPAAPAAAAPKGKAKAKAEAAAPKAQAAAPKAAAAAPKAEAAAPKAKAKGKAEPQAAAPKGKAKAKGQPKLVEVAPAPKEELPINVFLDDGSGGAWETTAKTKKEKKDKKADQQGETTKGDKAAAAPARSGAAKGAAPAAQASSGDAKERARERAAAEVARILAMKVEADPKVPTASAHVDSVVVPEPKIGIVIGLKGSTIKKIQEVSKVTRIDTAGGVFTISGEEEAVKIAKKAIQDTVEKGYCTLFYEEFGEGFVNCHPQYFPDIIGTRGSIINTIKKKLNVEVTLPELPEDRKGAQTFKIKLAGEAKKVEEAKDVINSIIMHQHHEITHPGQVHEEMEIEEWLYSYIIGRGGSEMKHIQKNWEVKVNIPRAHSVNNKVLIVGMPENVKRSKAYIEKLVMEAESKATNPREKAEDSQDKWADKDDAVDPGLEGYVVKRAN